MCEPCGDTGTYGIAPDGERVYCDCDAGRRAEMEHLNHHARCLIEHGGLDTELNIVLAQRDALERTEDG